MAVSFVCISLALGTVFVIQTVLPSGEWNPFQFLECDVQGGYADQIEGADTAKALVLAQYPLVDGRDPNLVLSLSWPKHMTAQDLYL